MNQFGYVKHGGFIFRLEGWSVRPLGGQSFSWASILLEVCVNQRRS